MSHRGRVQVAFGVLILLGSVAAVAQLQTLGAVILGQGSPGVAGTPELGDDFGRALAVGDFNCDGFSDLAVGVPWEDSDVTHSGAVNVFYGGPAGLSSAELWDQSSSGVPSSNEEHDHFGAALAAFRSPLQNCDNLAVGAPDEDVNGTLTHVDAGAVFIFRGTSGGLVADGILVQGQDGVPELPEDGDHFGAAISQGPTVDGGFPTDCPPGTAEDMTLMIGAPGEGLGAFDNGDGALVQIILPCSGEDGGGQMPSFANCTVDLTTPCRVISADDFLLPLNLNPYDGQFGSSLAWLGRVSSEAYPELGWEFLAVGVPYADNGAPVSNSGAVLEMDPSLDPDDSFYWQQGNNSLLGAPEAADHFGENLAAGDFDDDGRLDLAVGIPDEDVGAIGEAGAVQVIENGSSGLTGSDQLIDQDDLAGQSAAGSDRFGSALAVGDFDGDGVDDLAIGVNGENLTTPRSVVNAGAVNVLYGVDGVGISTSGAQQFDGDDLFFNGAQEQTFFGSALAAGDFDGNGIDDLAIGEPGSQDLANSFGYVWIVYGADNGILGHVGFLVADPSHPENVGSIQVDVNRTGSALLSANATVRVKPGAGGTATNGSDYNFTSAQVHWDAGELGIQSVFVPIVNDSEAELTETIVLEITGTSGGLGETNPAEVVLQITDNEPASFEFQLAETSTTEAVGNLSLLVLRTGGSWPAASVSWATVSGQGLIGAVAGQDFTASSGTLSWNAGQMGGKSVQIPILNDTTPEGDELFTVMLHSPSGAVLSSPAVTLVTILANDGGIFTDGFDGGSTSRWSTTFP